MQGQGHASDHLVARQVTPAIVDPLEVVDVRHRDGEAPAACPLGGQQREAFPERSAIGKPGAVISVSPGVIGGFGANHHLRQSMVFLDVPMMPQPEAYIGGASKLFDEQGQLSNEDTRKFVEKFVQAFAEWIERNAKR